MGMQEHVYKCSNTYEDSKIMLGIFNTYTHTPKINKKIKVNKQKGALSSKNSAPTFLHYEKGNAPFAAGAVDHPFGAGSQRFHSFEW